MSAAITSMFIVVNAAARGAAQSASTNTAAPDLSDAWIFMVPTLIVVPVFFLILILTRKKE